MAVEGRERSGLGEPQRWIRWWPTKIRTITSGDAMMLTSYGAGFAKRALIATLLITFVGCSKSASRSDQPSVKTFATLDDASSVLLAAAQSGDQAALLAILGPESKELISSGDAVQDKNDVNALASKYQAMHRWSRMQDGTQVLIVGPDNFAFPIPLKKNPAGQWFFDTAAGKEEILNRRIGRNELAIIQACEALATAQQQYFSQLHDGSAVKQFAMKFISNPGKQNGLYWQSEQGAPESPLGPQAAYATSEGYTVKPDAHMPFHGYYFHMLTSQSSKAPSGAKDFLVDGKMVRGFAFVAYPAEYGNSGVMTFIMNQDSLLLQKDLGPTTAQIASAMTQFDPGAGWTSTQD